MKVIGFSNFEFTGKQDNVKHTCLRVLLGDDIENEHKIGISSVEFVSYVDYSKDQLEFIKKCYKENINLNPLYNRWGKINELQLVQKDIK